MILLIKEKHIKTRWYYYLPNWMAKSKKLKIVNIDKDTKQLESSYNCWWEYKLAQTLWKVFHSYLLKLNICMCVCVTIGNYALDLTEMSASIYQKTWLRMFLAALLIKAKSLK